MSFLSASVNESFEMNGNANTFQPHFDLQNAMTFFQTGGEYTNAMTAFDKVLNEKALNLVQTISEKTKFVAFLTSIQAAIEGISDESIQIESVKQSCLAKAGNMLKGSDSASLIVILKTLPVLNVAEKLSSLVHKNIQINFPNQSFFFDFDEKSFTIRTAPSMVITCQITTVIENFYHLDPKIHLPEKSLFFAYEDAEISKYLEQHNVSSQCKSLIRIFVDLSSKIKELIPLQEGILSMLVEYAFIPNNEKFTIGLHFLRTLRMLAGGMFLGSNSGIPNKMANDGSKLNSRLDEEESINVTRACQKLLNLCLSGKLASIINIDSKVSIFTFKEL